MVDMDKIVSRASGEAYFSIERDLRPLEQVAAGYGRSVWS